MQAPGQFFAGSAGSIWLAADGHSPDHGFRKLVRQL